MTTKTITVGALARKPGRDGLWGVKIDGTDTWLNFPNKPEFNRGASVKVAYDEGSRVVSKFKVLEDGKPQGQGGGGFRKGGGGFSKPDPERESRIVYQHSQEMAVRLAEIIIANDAEKLGAKTKVEERKATLLSLVDELTARFHRDVFEQNALKAAKEIEDDLDEDEGADLPDDDDGFGDDNDDDLWEE